jgi:hypothetical protein
MPSVHPCAFALISSQAAAVREKVPPFSFGLISDSSGSEVALRCEDGNLHRFVSTEIETVTENDVPPAARDRLAGQEITTTGATVVVKCEAVEDDARRKELAFDVPAPPQNIHALGMTKRQPRADRQGLKEFSAEMRKLQKASPGQLNAMIAKARRCSELDAAIPIARLIDVKEIGICLDAEERAAVRSLVIERKSHREVEAATGISRSNLTPKVHQCIKKLAERGRDALTNWQGPLPVPLANFSEYLDGLETANYLDRCADDKPEYNVGFEELHGPTGRDDGRVDFDDHSADSAP